MGVVNRLTYIRNDLRKPNRQIEYIRYSLGRDVEERENIIESVLGIYKEIARY